jgi:hypothetical protein
MTRRLAAVLLAALTVGGAGATASQAATSAKAEGRKLITPIRAFESATRALRPQVRDALAAWQAKTTPCVARAKSDLTAAPNATEENTSLRVLVLYFQALVDGYKQSFAPVQPAGDRAERKWRRMSRRDSRLRLLARWQADGLGVMRQAPIPDTCSFYAEWKATGFDIARIPAATNTLLESVERFDSARVERAHRALLRLVGQRLATRFQKFPLAPTLATEDELTAPIDRALA